MKNLEKFKEYLSSGWSKSTEKHYVGAIRTISSELFNLGLIDCDIYLIEDEEVVKSLLQIYLNVKAFEDKDIRGNRMYSNALKRYTEFFNSEYKSKISESGVNYSSRTDKPKNKSHQTTKITQEKIERDAEVSGNAIADAGYKCEYNREHDFFISKSTGNTYVEAHHLIPMSATKDFDYCIDVEANVVALCVICHKKLHHGIFEEKLEMLSELYNQRKERLKKCNIGIEFDELQKYYK